MSMSAFPSRRQVEAAAPLDMEQSRSEKPAQITITVTPAGLSITAEYTGTLSSIPGAIERLRQAGVLDLVERSAPAQPAAPASPKAKAERVTPEYNAAGDACCPKHHKVLKQGQWGLYCPAKDDSTERGYCALKFAE